MSDPRDRLPERTRIRLVWWGLHAAILATLVVFALRS